jgi:hypothetical protein
MTIPAIAPPLSPPPTGEAAGTAGRFDAVGAKGAGVLRGEAAAAAVGVVDVFAAGVVEGVAVASVTPKTSVKVMMAVVGVVVDVRQDDSSCWPETDAMTVLVKLVVFKTVALTTYV